jgi:hypothetical protein
MLLAVGLLEAVEVQALQSLQAGSGPETGLDSW